jgi:hypothetical protein
LLRISTASALPSLTSLTSLSEDIEPAPGVRAGRAAEVVDCLADGTRLALGAAFFGTTASDTEARGRGVALGLTDAAESGEARNARCGAPGLAAAEEVVAEDNLPDVEADNVEDRAGGPADFAGANDVLRDGAGAEGVAVDGLGGMAGLEDGAEADTGDFFAGGWDEGADLRVGT